VRLNILYICYEDISSYNGATRHITEIANRLSANGHLISLCVPKLDRKTSGLTMKSNVILRLIPTIPFRIVRPLSYFVISFFYLPYLYFRLKPDIVYIRDIKFTILPVLLSRLNNVPCILEVNGLLDEALNVRRVSAWTFWILNTFHRWNIRNAGHIVTVTNGIRKEILLRYGISNEKISIINNGVDLTQFSPMDKKLAIKKTGLSQAYKYIGFIGGLFPWHGLDQLIEAAPHVLKNEPRARFVIVGAGLMEQRLKKMLSFRNLQRKFIFTGSVPFHMVPSYINAFDVCIVFFKKVRKDPGDPIKLYEYLACGRPVVASDVPGYGDIVKSANAGISVNSSDPIVTAEAILKLLRDNDKANDMGKRGLQKAQESFSWEKKVRETEQIMGTVLDRGQHMN
jgi:glycosyltransferase involved in cell wall biosynthesis